MAAQLAKAGAPAPKVIGIDEISIRKGHTYRIVVSDLLRQRPIWFGGTDRSEASMEAFFTWLGAKKSAGIRLAVMDMWKPFRTDTLTHPCAAGEHPVRQVPCAGPPERRARHGAQERVRPRGGQGPPLHQGLEVFPPARANLTLEGSRVSSSCPRPIERLNPAYLLLPRSNPSPR